MTSVGREANGGSVANEAFIENFLQNARREQPDRGYWQGNTSREDNVIQYCSIVRARRDNENRRRLLAREFVNMSVSCL